jgi:hypothetical protein
LDSTALGHEIVGDKFIVLCCVNSKTCVCSCFLDGDGASTGAARCRCRRCRRSAPPPPPPPMKALPPPRARARIHHARLFDRLILPLHDEGLGSHTPVFLFYPNCGPLLSLSRAPLSQRKPPRAAATAASEQLGTRTIRLPFAPPPRCALWFSGARASSLLEEGEERERGEEGRESPSLPFRRPAISHPRRAPRPTTAIAQSTRETRRAVEGGGGVRGRLLGRTGRIASYSSVFGGGERGEGERGLSLPLPSLSRLTLLPRPLPNRAVRSPTLEIGGARRGGDRGAALVSPEHTAVGSGGGERTESGGGRRQRRERRPRRRRPLSLDQRASSSRPSLTHTHTHKRRPNRQARAITQKLAL